MNWFQKTYWVFGILAAVVCFLNPLVGMFGILPLFMIFFLVIWDINMRQRQRYYQNPEKLYGTIHDVQRTVLPYSAAAVCIGGKIAALFSIVVQVVVEGGVAVGVLKNADRGYYHSMSFFNVIAEHQYRIVGIPMCILGIVFSISMSTAFWQRCGYYKNSIRGKQK